MQLIKRLFRGDIELAYTYWAGFVGVNMLLFFLFFALGLFFNSPLFWKATNVIYLAYFLFIGISIWRSAGKFTGRRIWAILARIIVVVNALKLLAGLVAPVAA